MKKTLFIFLYFSFHFLIFGQVDSLPNNKAKIDSIVQKQTVKLLTPDVYKERYQETDLMYKVTDNYGNGFDALYGTRNLRPILHGVAYRGGANNYFHKTAKRHNHNPLPDDGIRNLCQEGFSSTIYLYRQNFDSAPALDSCDCISGGENELKYYQFDYNDQKHIYEALKLIHNSALNDSVGPVYLHCWNGWHASGLLSALALRQFCGFDKWEAINYWDLGTDGANNSPRYQIIREMIKEFEPYPDLVITDSLGNKICPPMPKNIDKNELYVDIEQLIYVPESIPVGFEIVLHNVQFAAGKTSFHSPSTNKDIENLMQALKTHPEIKVEIGGYTDNTGAYDANVDFSEKRAKFIHDHLITNGIDANRLSYKGYGPKKPLYSNKYKSTREGNRRIEVKIIEKQKEDYNKLIEEDQTLNDSVPSIQMLFEQEPDANANQKYLLTSMIYPPNEVKVPESAQNELDQLVNWLKSNPFESMKINAHTDKSGLEDLNILLSQQRAEEVAQYIINHGISAEKISFEGHGSSTPIASNRFQHGKEKNRRVEVEIIFKK